MPELPEVEIMARNLARWTGGRRLQGVRLVDPRLDRDGLIDGLDGLVGARVQRVWRRGKYAVVDVDCLDGVERSLVLHFRMTGKVVVAAPGSRRAERLVLALEPTPGGPDHVVFDDTRRLGDAWLRPQAGIEAWFTADRKLGPEPWPEPRDAAFWRARVGGSTSPVKVALMDQKRVAGLGNIAASEILWHARIHPGTRASAVSDAGWASVARAVPQFISDTLERESGDEIAYVNSQGGSARGVASPFVVYRNDGRPCARCGGVVLRGKHAGRSTFWCGACQVEVP